MLAVTQTINVGALLFVVVTLLWVYQTDTSYFRFGPSRSCQLPPGAKWCRASHTNLVFAMEASDDYVSNVVCQGKVWESSVKPQEVQQAIEERLPGQPRHMYDIGANLGWWTLRYAALGWSVDAFEPLPRNRALLNASLCRNAKLLPKTAHVRVHPVALGAVDRPGTRCAAYSEVNNIADATICCEGDPCGGSMHVATNKRFVERGKVEVRSLDSYIRTMRGELGGRAPMPTFVKIDVEGYECAVLTGGMQVLSKPGPPLLMSEVNTYHSNLCSPREYLNRFQQAGYEIYLEPPRNVTRVKLLPAPPPQHVTRGGTTRDFWMASPMMAAGRAQFVLPSL